MRSSSVVPHRRVLGLGVASLAVVSGLVAVPVARADVPAPTVLSEELNICLRQASANPAGVLVITDGRLTPTHVEGLRLALREHGRPSCVYRALIDVQGAAAWWAGLPSSRRTDTVVLALPGTRDQFAAWSGQFPYRMLGTSDSGITPGSTVNGWIRSTQGYTAGRLILLRLGELTVDGGVWAGTSSANRLLSSSAQCAAAVASPRGVYVLGDSITSRDFSGIAAALKARGLVACIDAQSGSRVADHLARLTSIRLPKTVIVALGNNDVFQAARFRNDAYRSLLIIGKDRNVVWPTLWRTRPGTLLPQQQYNARVINRVIVDLSRSFPRMRVPDWYGVLVANPSLQYDGIHLSPTGLALRYDMFADNVEALLAAP